jgi:hypothetical protein
VSQIFLGMFVVEFHHVEFGFFRSASDGSFLYTSWYFHWLMLSLSPPLNAVPDNGAPGSPVGYCAHVGALPLVHVLFVFVVVSSVARGPIAESAYVVSGNGGRHQILSADPFDPARIPACGVPCTTQLPPPELAHPV